MNLADLISGWIPCIALLLGAGFAYSRIESRVEGPAKTPGVIGAACFVATAATFASGVVIESASAEAIGVFHGIGALFAAVGVVLLGQALVRSTVQSESSAEDPGSGYPGAGS